VYNLENHAAILSGEIDFYKSAARRALQCERCRGKSSFDEIRRDCQIIDIGQHLLLATRIPHGKFSPNSRLQSVISVFLTPIQSLWSINNMFPATTLIYTTIIVGLSTYLIVFNLNNLVLHVSKLYQSFRDQLIGRMKHKDDKDWGFWSDEGARFDVFKPQHDQAHPSEWWRFIFVFYLLLKHIKSVALPLKAKDDDEVETSSASSVCSSVSSDFSRFSANSRTSSAKSAPQGFQHVPAGA
jgi:hypothetical protein